MVKDVLRSAPQRSILDLVPYSDLINNTDDRREWVHQEDTDLEGALSTLEDRLSIQNYVGKWGK